MPTTTTLYNSATGGQTTDISVEQGETVMLVLYAPGGTTPSVQAMLQRKLGDGSWQRVPDDRGSPGMLGGGATEMVLGAPGVYRVVVPATGTVVRIEETR